MIRSGQRQAVKAAHITGSGKQALLDVHAKGKGMQQIKDKLAFGITGGQVQALKKAADGTFTSMIGFVVQSQIDRQGRGQAVVQADSLGDNGQPVGKVFFIIDIHMGIQRAENIINGIHDELAGNAGKGPAVAAEDLQVKIVVKI